MRALVLLAVVATGALAGMTDRWWRRRKAGSPSAGHGVGGGPPGVVLPGGIVLFTAPFCAACGRMREVLDSLGVGPVHVLDVVDHPDAVRRLDIRQAPTTFVVGPEGRVGARLSGVVTADEVRAALEQVGG